MKCDERQVDIAAVLVDARVGNPRRLAEERAPYDDVFSAVDRLFDLLAARGVEAVLVGGMAMLSYVEGRNTRDIDLILAVGDLGRLPELRVESHDQDFARAAFEGIQIDVLLTSNPLFETVRRDFSTRRQYSGRTLTCATVDGLVLLKLFALPSLYRQGDFARVSVYEGDIAALLEKYRPDVGELLGRLAMEVLPTDLASVRGILADIDARIERFRSSQGESAGE